MSAKKGKRQCPSWRERIGVDDTTGRRIRVRERCQFPEGHGGDHYTVFGKTFKKRKRERTR